MVFPINKLFVLVPIEIVVPDAKLSIVFIFRLFPVENVALPDNIS